MSPPNHAVADAVISYQRLLLPSIFSPLFPSEAPRESQQLVGARSSYGYY